MTNQGDNMVITSGSPSPLWARGLPFNFLSFNEITHLDLVAFIADILIWAALFFVISAIGKRKK